MDIKYISPAEVLSSSGVVILDVRTPEEYLRGHIKNSINLPLNDLSSKIKDVIKDPDQKIYVYCLSGSRSDNAVEAMQEELGFKNAYSLKQGLLAWRANKYPLVV